MSKNKDLPVVSRRMTLSDTLIEISSKGIGVALVVEKKRLVGIFTDGDLRRTLNQVKDPLSKKIENYMTKRTKTILKNKLAVEALDIMQKNKIYSIAVVDSKKVPVGVIRMHDLVEAGLV